MEIKVYYSFDCMKSEKAVFCQKVLDPDKFEFDGAKRFLKSVYGENAIIVLICV